MKDVLPNFINNRLKKALKSFGKKMPSRNGSSGYFTNEALLVATESRTSSPVRIPRDNEFLYHPQIKNLFPCGEGAGYAGGIVSAAMDGERVAKAVGVLLKAKWKTIYKKIFLHENVLYTFTGYQYFFGLINTEKIYSTSYNEHTGVTKS